MARSLFRTSVLVSLALMLSRFSGLIREQVLGARLGLSADMDAALLILTLPDLMVGLLLSGGFTAALVPALTKAEPHDRVALTRRMMVRTALGAVVLSALLIIAMPLVLALLAPSLDVTRVYAFRTGFALALAAIPVSAVIGVSSSYLNVKGSYSTPALTVIGFNGLLVVYFIYGLPQPVNFTAFALVVVAATGLRFVIQAARMPEILLWPFQSGSLPHFEKGFSASFLKGIAGASLIVAVPLVFRSLYSLGGDGELARFNYALRIFELPMGILIGPITLIFLPLLSHLHARVEREFHARAALALRAAFLLGLTGALTTMLYAQPIVSLVFGFGELRGEGSAAIAVAVRTIMLALPFMAAFQALATALNACEQTGHVLRISCIAFMASLSVALALRAIGTNPAFAAQTGFITFTILASAMAFRAVFLAAWTGAMLLQLTVITLRSFVAALPFVVLDLTEAAPESRVLDILLMVLLALAILAANLPILRELAQIRDTHRSTT